MANPSTGHPTADQNSTDQGSMFDDATDEATDAAMLEAYESEYEMREDSPYEASEDLSDDSLDLFSAHEDQQDEDEYTVIETAEDAAPASVESPIESPVAASEPYPESAQQAVTPESHAASEPPAEPEVAQESNPLPESAAVLTADDFAALEERIVRAVTLVRSERKARIAAEERAASLAAELQAQIPAIDRLQREVDGLRVEREQVRQRIDRLLGQLDALEL